MTAVDLTDMELTTLPARATPIEIVRQSEVMLSAEEARQIVKNINGRFEQSRKDLMELEDREGWRALGYDSWRTCVMAEFSQSVATLYRQLEAAKIEREIFGVSQLETPTPTAQLQAVRHLPTEQKRAAFKRADELAGDQPRRTAHVQIAAAEIAAPDLPIDYSVVQRRLATHGVTLSHKDGTFALADRGGAMSSTRMWDQVLDRLSLLEDGMDDVYTPALDPAAASTALSPSDLDATLPKALSDAGYYWHSATPPTIRHNSGWQADAPTVEQALELARLHKDAKGEPITVFPALTPMECKALIREAKIFIEGGADRKLPTIGKILRIAARVALEATE